MAPESLKRLARASKKRSETIAYTSRGPSPVRMRNTYSRAKSKIHPLPAIIDFKQGAGVWVSYGTAYHALYRWAEARASETALVHGASGGVGVAALQIAR